MPVPALSAVGVAAREKHRHESGRRRRSHLTMWTPTKRISKTSAPAPPKSRGEARRLVAAAVAAVAAAAAAVAAAEAAAAEAAAAVAVAVAAVVVARPQTKNLCSS